MRGDAPDAAGGDGFAQGVVEVVVSDLERSLAFYLSIGFEQLRRSGPFAVVHWRGQRLFLAEDRGAPAAPRWINLRIMVDDIDAVWERMRALGIAAVHPIGDRHFGLRDFTLVDPSGFEIRFAQPIESPAGQTSPL
jgi:catechol 2,3-dioxygenase-like lactoylglutathione lyase family enzyme